MNIYRVKESVVFTIFGASGNLAHLMIFPAIFALAEQKRLEGKFMIVGFARTEISHAAFREIFKKSILEKYKTLNDYQVEVLEDLLGKVFYVSGQYDQKDGFEAYQKLVSEKMKNSENLVQNFYFSVPPVLFQPIVKNLAVVRKKDEDYRLILEKPFGEDKESAQKLLHFIHQFFREKEIYLLDHYLGKKAIRSILPLRYANRILFSMLQGSEIANIQITAFENMDVENRISYFDRTGTIKDMFQSHLLQILAYLIMDIPVKKTTEHIRKEKTGILSALYFESKKSNISLGQYQKYCNEAEFCKLSTTETFAALRIFLNQKDWYNVPIYLRSGKNLHEKHTYISIELKKFPFQDPQTPPNRIVIEMAPDEKIHLQLVDQDGSVSKEDTISTMDSIACEGDYCLPTHGLLFLDVMRRDQRYFLSVSEILASWDLVDQIMEFIRAEKPKREKYKTGTKGPKGQNDLVEKDGFAWYDLH